jgi:hypothetical protein
LPLAEGSLVSKIVSMIMRWHAHKEVAKKRYRRGDGNGRKERRRGLQRL